MWGPEGVTRAVADNLLSNLPAAIARLRTVRAVSAAELPDVARVYPTPREFAEIGAYPAVMLAARETQGQLETRTTEIGAEHDEFQLTYRVRALIFCMGTSYDQTELLTQRITLAVREALLTNKRYGDPENGNGAVLDARLLRESYAETAASSGGYLGGAWVEIGVRSYERLVSPYASPGVAEAISVHPALLDEP
ncbi:hypothetical protein SEA_PRAIRIE_12 [Arthrobacter phage Prairie]|uniref:Uncharacterized protein n=1 Tax=Arthrobacter phage Prairie TaxID=2816463 RepID=A0A8A5LMK2_9CAUD|nr:hypothetical protein SEA_PRAIRIE_12 [Arthrobacter phage Prairie]